MKTRIIYGLLAGLAFSLYWLTWMGALLFVGIIGAYLFILVIKLFLQRRNYLGIFTALLAGGYTAWLFLSRVIPRNFTELEGATIMELQPLNLFSAWQNFGFTTFLIPVALALLVYQVAKRGSSPLILLLVWSVVILVAMLEYRRFAYYFAVNASLLGGWFIWYLWGKLSRWNLPKAIAVTAILCGLVVFPNIQMITAPKNYHTPSDAWYQALTWLKANSHKDSLVLAWWDYGYWIERIADREAYIKGGVSAPEVTKTAYFFMDPIGISPINFDYLILDYSTTIPPKFRAISRWTGSQVEAFTPEYYQSLVVKLYEDELSYQYLIVYRSESEMIEGIPEVKVFKCRKIIDGQ